MFFNIEAVCDILSDVHINRETSCYLFVSVCQDFLSHPCVNRFKMARKRNEIKLLFIFRRKTVFKLRQDMNNLSKYQLLELYMFLNFLIIVL